MKATGKNNMQISIHFDDQTATPINLYIDDQTAQRIDNAAQKNGELRDALIRRSFTEWLTHSGTSLWPDEVLAFKGTADIPLFESGRDKLVNSVKDPLG